MGALSSYPMTGEKLFNREALKNVQVFENLLNVPMELNKANLSQLTI